MTDIIKSFDKISIPTRNEIIFLARLHQKPPILKQRRNTERISPKELVRPTDVVVIGDLHGNINALWGNLKASELIDKNNNWIGGDTHVVFVGDILADRHSNGIEILMEIQKLNNQANNVNGRIDTLAGNHDDFATSFLMGISNAENAHFYNYYSALNGMTEFNKYATYPIPDNIIKNIPIKDLLILLANNLNHNEILRNLRKTNTGISILELICNMQILTQIDDSIFTHTDMTMEMADYIVKNGIDFINNVYINGKKDILLKGKRLSTLSQDFFKIQTIFLNSNNRLKYILDHSYAELLKEVGINHIIHGHSNTLFNHVIINHIKISSADNEAYKYINKCNAKSFIKIEKTSIIVGYNEKIKHIYLPEFTGIDFKIKIGDIFIIDINPNDHILDHGWELIKIKNDKYTLKNKRRKIIMSFKEIHNIKENQEIWLKEYNH